MIKLMKKLLLSLCAVAVSAFAFSQTCTPNQVWADTVSGGYGAYPDTIVNFPPAEQNVFYSTDLNFLVPEEVTEELDDTGAFVGSPIEGFVVTGVSGIPAGMDYACNIASCEYPGGANGCANLYGTPTDVGTYNVEINVTATIIISVLGLPVPVEQQTSFTGYKIVVAEEGTSNLVAHVIQPLTLYPNPAQNKVTVSNVAGMLNASHISITDVTGKEVLRAAASAQSDYTFDVSAFDQGLYFVNVHYASGVESIKFIKD
jgi:hypothetical protein